MDIKQLLKDIFTLKFSSHKVRWFKLKAVIKRRLFAQKKYNNATSFYNIPIIINNRNRLTYLKEQVDWLTRAGYTNIYILDNDSNYQPLLDFYKTTSCKIIYLKENLGHLAFWKSDVYKQFQNDYYVYTDPDVVPIEQCPNDFMNHFFNKLQQYPNIEKIGFALKIDDLPDYYAKKKRIKL